MRAPLLVPPAGARAAPVAPAARIALAALAALLPSAAFAHGVSELAQQRMLSGGYLDAAWIGAEHMLTGYDHLLFLFGVLLFLDSFGRILAFVTAFTVGHTLTLLFATLNGISADPHLVDAVIALTVIYKAFENLDGFRRWLNAPAPSLLAMVFAFGLIHGFGLSTRLQQMTLVHDQQLVGKILAFNVGVELGQVAALTAMAAVLGVWRASPAFPILARVANAALITVGAGLFVFQIHQYLGGASSA